MPYRQRHTPDPTASSGGISRHHCVPYGLFEAGCERGCVSECKSMQRLLPLDIIKRSNVHVVLDYTSAIQFNGLCLVIVPRIQHLPRLFLMVESWMLSDLVWGEWGLELPLDVHLGSFVASLMSHWCTLGGILEGWQLLWILLHVFSIWIKMTFFVVHWSSGAVDMAL